MSAGRVIPNRALTSPRAAHSFALALGCALLLGYVVARFGASVAVALLLLPVGGYLLLRHPLNGLLFGLSVILIVPYWLTLGTAQSAVFRLASLVALLTCLFARRLRLTSVDMAVVALVAVAVLSWLLRDDQGGVGKILLNLFVPLSFYAAGRTVPPDSIPRIMTVALFAGTVGSLSVFYEAYIGHAVFIDPSSYSWNASDSTIFRAGGVFGSPPGAATVLAISSLCGVPAFRAAAGRRRLLVGCCLSLSVAGCILTFTRASVIGLAVGLVVYLALSRSPLLRPGRLMFGLLALIVVLLVALPTLEGSTRFQRGVVRPGNVTGRIQYWELALPIAKSSPHNLLFGIGPARTLVARQGGTISADLAGAPVLVSYGTHNQYVLALLEQGLLGLAALLVWLGTTIVRGLIGCRHKIDPTAAALTGAIVAFAIVMMANNAILHPPSLAIGALVSGLLVARRPSRSSSTQTGQPIRIGH